MNYGPTDEVIKILDEMKAPQSTMNNYMTKVAEEDDETELNKQNLENFILQNGKKTIAITDKIIKALTSQLEVTPDDPELITSIAEMVSSHNRALETMSKLHLNNEKLRQAKEIEQFKQSIKLTIADKQLENRGYIGTRDEIMQMLLESDAIKEERKAKATKIVDAEVID